MSQLNFILAAADTGRAGGGVPWLEIFMSLIKNDPWGFALASAMYFKSVSWLPPVVMVIWALSPPAVLLAPRIRRRLRRWLAGRAA